MSRNHRRIQKNGRERANPGDGLGDIQQWSPLARGMQTKNKQETQKREDRRNKQGGWEM